MGKNTQRSSRRAPEAARQRAETLSRAILTVGPGRTTQVSADDLQRIDREFKRALAVEATQGKTRR